MKRQNLTLLGITTSLFLGIAFSASAQESKQELIEKLRGSAGTKEKTAGKTRGLTRGFIPAAEKKTPQSETRKVLLPSRGIPKAIQIATEEGKVKVAKVVATKSDGAGDYSVAAGKEAVEVSYTVDPKSKVTRSNILFIKGRSDFANQESLDVVVELADALKDDSLANLKFVIEGHASADGSAAANQTLSQARSQRIVQELGLRGVPADRLLPIGFGETKARFSSSSRESNLAQDRRVVVYRMDQ